MSRIGVYTMNKHRCNTMLASMLVKALGELNHEVYTAIDTTVKLDYAIVLNGTKDIECISRLDMLQASNTPIVLFIDDVDIPSIDILHKALVFPKIFVTQFISDLASSIQFPIAELLTMDDRWVAPIKEVKCKPFTWFYGGTFKDRREYKAFFTDAMLRNANILLTGDSESWDIITTHLNNVARVGTIRDLDTLYDMMSLCKNTVIVYDEKHYNKGTTLRFFEAAMLGLAVWVYDEKGVATCFNADSIRKLYTRELFLEKLNVLHNAILNRVKDK